MPSLKILRNRINSVKSTQKITSAMKMVAAAKLRRAQAQAEASRPYAVRMAEMLSALAASEAGNPNGHKLLVGNGKSQTHLLVAVTADRGLAGAFNANIAKQVRQKAAALQAEGKSVKIFALGRKGNDALRRDMGSQIVGAKNFVGKKVVTFADAEEVAQEVIRGFRAGEYDVVTLVFNRFHSVMTQKPFEQPLIPAAAPTANDNKVEHNYEVEPDDGTLLDRLLPRNLAVQIYAALLENAAGFYAAQMTAMDSATRNAGQMIKRLTLDYNRARQANITKELIEIISGAEAV
ncbi:F0F1 ATP synthase subunit gamma [Acidocella aminolytica]|jgi:F-type H+-transporting ATPase subunit gamma|uniref:ATP synthase gamma chain n=1 Tax=Acidocella aminolytica 101 = DSM 11237 TaxID=1120923 RepID=A0A0D6PGJ9_9PROT|nr:F0F1 ATP synthase subunit gamma [Acidocella aminolytica]GAN80900.1 ATP synthase F1 subunit gamma [Acidocella aminolytica 101 = DSM 11237]GBQ37426.1 ATP synthase F0F1 subunit gamma [Acidocella aminolytica 101 = DSM 11237]SHF11951.1 ATP synthase F1 subcomplex gamma subunit [Acidocella aminolytica 101 = DSM 11237]